MWLFTLVIKYLFFSKTRSEFWLFFLTFEIIKAPFFKNFSDIFTDDASVFESNGGKINTLLGEEKNLKITTKEDLKIASILVS